MGLRPWEGHAPTIGFKRRLWSRCRREAYICTPAGRLQQSSTLKMVEVHPREESVEGFKRFSVCRGYRVAWKRVGRRQSEAGEGQRPSPTAPLLQHQHLSMFLSRVSCLKTWCPSTSFASVNLSNIKCSLTFNGIYECLFSHFCKWRPNGIKETFHFLS